MELIDWQGHLAIFDGNKNTRPVKEIKGGFEDISESLAPGAGPMVSSDKQSIKYFLPTQLKKAPLIGETKKYAEQNGHPLIGKQRSASHVTTANMLVLDIDGLPKENIKICLKKLKSKNLAFLVFSSYSNGNPEKKGVRCRLIIPVDTPIDSNDYKKVANAFSSLYLSGQADKSGATLCQQQGIWATHPKWKKKAFKIMSPGSVTSSAELIAKSPVRNFLEAKKVQNTFKSTLCHEIFNTTRVRLALTWIDPNPYKSWVDTAIFLKAAFGDEAYGVWLEWSNSATEDIKVGNTANYAPDAVWDNCDPFLSPDMAAGALFLKARDETDKIAQRAVDTSNWDRRAQDAIGYLMAHHSTFFHDNYEGKK